ncbi:hypothetical protein [Dyadobacter luteus]|jgi:hypothetical protein|nr:hypothetical protein [Dyadobacter luteus]
MDLLLQTKIYNILAGLADDSGHYVVHSRYYFFGQQMYSCEPLHLSKDTVKEIELTENGIQCRMKLDSDIGSSNFPIMIPFVNIERIVRLNEHMEKSQSMVWKRNVCCKGAKNKTCPSFMASHYEY